jgi:hypothetical protein
MVRLTTWTVALSEPIVFFSGLGNQIWIYVASGIYSEAKALLLKRSRKGLKWGMTEK